jgi:hypothetical protein
LIIVVRVAVRFLGKDDGFAEFKTNIGPGYDPT